MSEQKATPPPSEKARAWAKEQIEKHGPPPQSLVDHVNRLRRKAIEARKTKVKGVS